MTVLIIIGSVRRFCRRTLFEVILEVAMPEGYPLIRFSSAAPV